MTATAPLEGEEGEAILAAAEARSVSRAPCRELLAFGLHKESQRKCDIAHTLQRPACEDCDRNCTKNVQLRSQSSPNRRRGAVFTAATSELRQFDPQPAAAAAAAAATVTVHTCQLQRELVVMHGRSLGIFRQGVSRSP